VDFFAGRTPNDLFCRLPSAKMGRLGRFLPFIEKLVEGNFEGAGELLKRLDGRHGVTVLYSEDRCAQGRCPNTEVMESYHLRLLKEVLRPPGRVNRQGA
jgi:hypothetical protein